MRPWLLGLALWGCNQTAGTISGLQVDDPDASPDTATGDTDEPWVGDWPPDDEDTADPADTALDDPAPVPHPIVLSHGFFGFETFAGVDFVTYYYGVKDRLEAEGELHVFTPAVDPFSDSVSRGDELLEAIEDILAETGADKVNLIAHSQGGLDSRRVASLRPDLVESITTIATPHEGTRVADIATGLIPFPGVQGVVDAIVAAVAGPLWEASGDTTSLFASLEQLSSDGVADFVADHPDGPGVTYYSIGGRSDRHDGGSECQVAGGRPGFITRWDDQLDPIEPLLALTEGIADGGLFDNDPNDGLVRVADSKHGRFLGCIPADHFDQIGHLFGDGGGQGNAFDHLLFYEELVRWLRAQGH